MAKFFFIMVGLVGTFFLINAYAPGTWTAGFHVPVGEHGFKVPWALTILGGVLTIGIVKLKSK